MPIGILPDFISQLFGGQQEFNVPELQQYEEPNSWAQPWLRDILNRRGGIQLTETGEAIFGGPSEDLVPSDPVPPDPLKVTRAAAQESIARKRDAAKADEEAKQTLLDLAGAREQDEWIRSLGYEPDQRLSEPEKGIAIEDMPADKLLRIQAQARAKGRRGSLRGGEPTYEDYRQGIGGGGFSDFDSPEARARDAETQAWLANQPMRDAMYELQLAQQRKDQAGTQSAREQLMGLMQIGEAQKKQRLTESIVNSMADTGGKIPFEKAQQLSMMGVSVPYQAIGSSAEDATAYFDSAIEAAANKLNALGSTPFVDEGSKLQAVIERKGQILAERFKQMVATGQMSPDDAVRLFQQQLAQDAMQMGLLSYNQTQAELPIEGE